MNNPQCGTDFVKALMAQEFLLNSTDFNLHRGRILERLARAERRERRARWVTVVIAGVGLVGFALLGAVNLDKIGHSSAWAEWVSNLAATTFLLLPIAVSLMVALYLFRHRCELKNARQEADLHMLAELKMQIEDLKRRLPDEDITSDSAEGPAGGQAKRADLKGFTLIELLVVVSILGILTGLLLPSLALAKARARTTVCQNNLGQIGRALAMYVGAFHRYPGTCSNPIMPSEVVAPHLRDRESSSSEDLPWDFRLLPYLSYDYSRMCCPAHAPSKRKAIIPDYRANYNYGYNAFGSGVNGPPQNLGLGCSWVTHEKPATGFMNSSSLVSESSVLAPADMIAIADRKGGDVLTTALVMPGDPVKPSDNDPGDCHRGRANGVFCDSHVEGVRQTLWKQRSEGARRRWNNDHQPHPESW